MLPMKTTLMLPALLAVALPGFAGNVTTPTPSISGHYLEVRSCDVYTGPCFANAEMGLTGKEGILVWSVSKGAWKGTDLKGLSVIAVIKTAQTLGDQRYNPRQGKAVLVVDEKADSQQQRALVDMAQSLAGSLVQDVAQVNTRRIESEIGACGEPGRARVKVADLLEVSTSCLGGKDHLCGNEENYYPPLTQVNGAMAAFTELSAFKGEGLDVTWQTSGLRSAYLASFAH